MDAGDLVFRNRTGRFQFHIIGIVSTEIMISAACSFRYHFLQLCHVDCIGIFRTGCHVSNLAGIGLGDLFRFSCSFNDVPVFVYVVAVCVGLGIGKGLAAHRYRCCRGCPGAGIDFFRGQRLGFPQGIVPGFTRFNISQCVGT